MDKLPYEVIVAILSYKKSIKNHKLFKSSKLLFKMKKFFNFEKINFKKQNYINTYFTHYQPFQKMSFGSQHNITISSDLRPIGVLKFNTAVEVKQLLYSSSINEMKVTAIY